MRAVRRGTIGSLGPVVQEKEQCVSFVPSMGRVMEGSELRAITLGDPLVDAYLEFVGARGAVNTWLATAAKQLPGLGPRFHLAGYGRS